MGRNRLTDQARAALKALPRSLASFTENLLWTVLSWTIKLIAFGWVLSLFADLGYRSSLLGAMGGELSNVSFGQLGGGLELRF